MKTPNRLEASKLYRQDHRELFDTRDKRVACLCRKPYICFKSSRSIENINQKKLNKDAHVIADESNKMRTVLLRKVEKSKNGGPSHCLLLSLIFLF
jgi:hypothetical protein